MGIVYRATDPIINRTVAIKKIRNTAIEGSSGSTESHDRFFNEIKAVGQLSHPNIIEVYDSGEHEDEPYLVTRYIDGKPLRKELDTHKVLDTERALTICRQILSALDHAHKKGIIHRDLKPSNILIDEEGNTKVIDFGLAKTKGSSLTQSGMTMGTLWYMSPEQVLGHNSSISERTDIFSVGVILYEMLSGERPFTGSDASVVQKILNLDPVFPSLLNATVPKWLDAVIAKAMAKSPADRFPSAAAFAAALDKQGLSGATDTPTGRRPGDTRRWPVWQKLAAGLLGLAVIGGAGYVAGRAMMDDGGGNAVAERGGPGSTDPVPAVADERPGQGPPEGRQPATGGTGQEAPAEAEPDPRATEQAAWERALAASSIDGFERFLADHPDGLYATDARRRLNALEHRAAEQAAWEAALAANTIAAFESFLDEYPDGTNAATAVRRLQALERVAADDVAWAQANQAPSAEAFRAYLADFPNGLHAAEARRRLAAIEEEAAQRAAWEAVREADTVEALEAFLDEHPDSVHAETARRRVEALRHSAADAAAWQQALDRASPDAMRAYLTAYPDGLHAQEARTRLDALERAALEDAAWEAARGANTEEALDAFVADHPDSIHAETARRRIAALERAAADAALWQEVLRNPTVRALETYLADFPDGVHATEARRRLAALPSLAVTEASGDDAGETGSGPGETERDAEGSGARTGPEETATEETAPTESAREETAPEQTAREESTPDAAAQDGEDGEVSEDEGRAAADAEAALGLSRFQRVQVQRGLTAVGHNPGGADGVLGPRSREAIGAWQAAIGAESTGYLNRSQANRLQQSAPPISTATPDRDAAPEETVDCANAGEETTRTFAISIGPIAALGPRSIARRQCQTEIDAAVARCRAEGGEVLPREPRCTCMNDWAATECFFQPATQPSFRCEVTEVAAVPEACR